MVGEEKMDSKKTDAQREELFAKMRSGEKIDSNRKNILVCGGTGCTSSKSPKIVEELEKGVEIKFDTTVSNLIVENNC